MYPAAKPIAVKGKLIRIDIDPLQLVNQLPADIAIFADSALAVAALNEALGGAAGQSAGKAKNAPQRCARGSQRRLWPACRTHGRLLSVITRGPARRGHRRRPDRAGLCRQPDL